MNDILNDIGAAILAQEHGLTDLANQYLEQVVARLDGMALTVDVPLGNNRTMTVTIKARKVKNDHASEN